MRRLSLILCLIMSLLLIPGCSSSTTPTAKQQSITTAQPDKPAAVDQQQTKTDQDKGTTAQPATPGPEKPAAIEQPAEKQTVTVYITRTGAKYHSEGCQYLRKSCIPISLDKAKARGYEPCSKCGPPE